MVAINEHVNFSFVTEEVAGCYSADVGRPSFPPEVLFRALFLEVWGGGCRTCRCAAS